MKRSFTLGVAAAALILGTAIADENKTAKVGTAAPAFTLKGIDGKEVKLEDLKGKVVVLEWFNPDCPFVVKHYVKNTTMQDTVKKFKDKDVVWLAIATGKTADEGKLKKVAGDWKIERPILLDSTGEVARAYESKCTPHMFVIDKEGVLVYSGAIDDNKDRETKGKTNYVDEAVTAVLAGEQVKNATNTPYGCSIKHASN